MKKEIESQGKDRIFRRSGCAEQVRATCRPLVIGVCNPCAKVASHERHLKCLIFSSACYFFKRSPMFSEVKTEDLRAVAPRATRRGFSGG